MVQQGCDILIVVIAVTSAKENKYIFLYCCPWLCVTFKYLGCFGFPGTQASNMPLRRIII